MKHILILLLFSGICLAQGVRFGDGQPTQTTTTVPGVSSSIIVAVPGATINFCTAPANSVPCTNKAATFTDATMSVACPSSIQLVLAGTNGCVSTTDARGNWGVWVAAGQYEYTVTINGASSGPFPATAGGSTASGSGNCPAGSAAISYFNGAATLCDPNAQLDGNGNATLASITASGTVTGGTIKSSGAGGIVDFTEQTAPSNPASGHDACYMDSSSHLLTCLNSSGGSALGNGALWSGLTQGTNSTAGTYVASGNSWDFTGSTIFKLRIGAGLTSSAQGDQGYDTTNKMWHTWQNGADNFLLTAVASGTFTNGDCVSLTKSGNIINLADAATTCGGSGSASEFLFGSGSTAPSTTVANWIGLGNAGATEAAQQIPVTRSGTVAQLQCRIGATLSSSMTYTLTVSHGSASNGAITSADTALTCTINSTNTNGCGDTTHSFSVAAGDVLDVHVVPANSPTSTTFRCSVQF